MAYTPTTCEQMMSRKPRLIVIPPQHLGHEIHVGRCVVVDMLVNNFLSPADGDCIITGIPDRRFLYESLFGLHNVYDFSFFQSNSFSINPPKIIIEYTNLPSSYFSEFDEFKKFTIINLSDYSLPPPYCTFGTSKEMEEIGYFIPNQYWSNEFIEFSKSFNFSFENSILEIVNFKFPFFIVIHHRYDASIDNLRAIVNSLPSELPKIIFSNSSKVLKNYFVNSDSLLLFTDDLKIYASLLKSEKCKLLITEWSGAGQLAQYILGRQGGIWYYYDYYQDVFNFTKTHKIWELNAKLGNYFNCWDFKNTSGCDSQHFSTFDNLIIALNNIKVN